MTGAKLPFVPWRQFLEQWEWRQGEHVLVIGRTGQGKTTLLSRILDRRRYVAMLATKNHDPVLRKDFPGFHVTEEWPRRPAHDKIMLWPRSGGTLRELRARQSDVFADALDRIFHDRGWCVVIDEAHWMTTELGLGKELATYQHQARSSGISVVTGVQRPAHIPVITYGSASWAFIGRQNEPADVKRLSDLGGVDSRELSRHVLSLPKYEFAVVDNRGLSDPVRTRVEL